MSLNFQNEYLNTEYIANQIKLLMNRGYSFYLRLHEDYQEKLKSVAEAHNPNFDEVLRELKKKLLEEEQIKLLDKCLEEFLEIKFRLKGQFAPKDNEYFCGDELFEIIDSISKQLQVHIEFKKYKDVALNNQSFVDFVHQINQVRLKWEKFLSKYEFAESIYRPDLNKGLTEGYVGLRFNFTSEAPRSMSNKQFKAFLTMCEDLVEFIVKTKSESFDDKELLQLSDVSLINDIRINFGMEQRIYLDFFSFFKHLNSDSNDLDSIFKKALFKSLPDSGKISGKEATNLINQTTKKLRKSAKLFENDFDVVMVNPINPSDISAKKDLPKTDLSLTENEAQNNSEKPDTPKKNLPESKPDFEEIKKSKAHIGFLTG